MQQPKMYVIDGNGKHLGVKRIINVGWSSEGYVNQAVIDFAGNGFGVVTMYDNAGLREFVGHSGNLKGYILLN
jgi:hypothetical protein